MSEFERWEKRYATPDYHFGTAPNAFLKRKAPLLKAKAGQKALSIADGEGRNGVFIAECGLDVTRVRLLAGGVGQGAGARQGSRRQHAVRAGRSLQIPVADEEYDVVAAIFFQFCPPPIRAEVFAGMKRALKRGGLLLMEGYRPEQLKFKTGGPSEVENLYTRALLEQSFADFASVEIEEYDAEVKEGAGHGGMSALIDFVGRK